MADVFKPGDVVRLKSGGPLMTVEKRVPTGIQCTWFDGMNVMSHSFRPESLVLADTSKGDVTIQMGD